MIIGLDTIGYLSLYRIGYLSTKAINSFTIYFGYDNYNSTKSSISFSNKNDPGKSGFYWIYYYYYSSKIK